MLNINTLPCGHGQTEICNFLKIYLIKIGMIGSNMSDLKVAKSAARDKEWKLSGTALRQLSAVWYSAESS